ncbi:MAG: hypothetical protein CL908_21950 [Deltaproteobacteria bacterium]|nr:hypothetical protein [Deltaproteobacteria bacterium]
MSHLWTWVETLSGSGALVLSEDESRHVAARRLRVGDALTLFDGHGRRAEARIEAIAKRAVEVEVAEVTEVPRPASLPVLASAIPKGERLSSMLQTMTQLGVGVWQPLVLEDSVVRKIDPQAKRLRRILVEGCKVARREWALEVRPVCSLDAAVAAASGRGPIFYADREGAARALDPAASVVLVGPEAGFSESEFRVLRDADAEPRTFAPHNLRIETAVAAAAVALQLGRGSEGGPDGD